MLNLRPFAVPLACIEQDLEKHLVSLRVCGISDHTESETTQEGSANVENEDIQVASSATPKTVSFLHVEPHICFYECDDGGGSDEEDADALTVPFSTVTKLPSAEQEGLWDSLHYSTGIKPRLLSYLSSGKQFRNDGVHACIITWNG